MRTIYLDNVWDIEGSMIRKDTDTRLEEPDSGRSDGEGWLSLTQGGAEIHADLRKTLDPVVGVPGDYLASIGSATLRTHLLAYAETVIWQAVKFGSQLLVWEPLLVREFRPA